MSTASSTLAAAADHPYISLPRGPNIPHVLVGGLHIPLGGSPLPPSTLPGILPPHAGSLLKTGNSRGGTSALLNRNLTDQASFTTRYPDPQTTSILFNNVLVC